MHSPIITREHRIMSAQIIDGKRIATELKQKIAHQIQQEVQQGKRAPGLAVVLVGDDPASAVYVNHKKKACQEVGIISIAHHLPAMTTEKALLDIITLLNEDTRIDGILVQLPLPAHIRAEAIIEAINPSKDVDGFHPVNIGALAQRRPRLRPCTPAGVMELLSSTGVSLHGLEMTIVGASNIVGRPLALEALLAGCTPTVCHRFTQNLQAHVERAECVVSAVGKINLIPGEWIKPGAIVIDVGINRLSSGQLVGDMDFVGAFERASFITPVPGGVGPMTVAKLMENTLLAARQ